MDAETNKSLTAELGRRRIKTPLLIPIPDDFPTYLASVSKSARYEYRVAVKACAELQYKEIPFDREMVEEWMNLWSRQVVYGKRIIWAPWTTPKIFEQLGVKVFFASKAMQMLEICDDYAYAQPVMYDKIKNPHVAKFMWFELIKWCCGRVKYLDLDGGNNKTWRQALKNKKASYKWLYVPKEIKNNPDAAPEWIVFACACGWKTLGEDRCSRCASG